MKFPFHSLRTSVMGHLALLILSAMLLINVVMIKAAEKHLINNKLRTGYLLLDTLTQKIAFEISCRNKSLEELGSNTSFNNDIDQILSSNGFSKILIVKGYGTKILKLGPWGDAEKNAMAISRETLTTKKTSFNFHGTTWSVIWLARETIHISKPVLIEDRLVGAITICADLQPLYQTLRESENSILIYIGLSTILLVLFGLYLLSRTVVKPIHGLLKITNEFKGMDSVHALTDPSRNELGQLSRSLNQMLERLEQNKKAQKEYISSLEKANAETKKAHDEIIKSEKFASLGRLATGVAHEIGNPIGIVLGYIELLKGNDLAKKEKMDFLARMESEVTRINQIIKNLLDYSRTSSGVVAETSVHLLIIETLYMLSPQPMMAHVQIKHTLDASKDIIIADPNQLKQIFLNIIMNAADAIGENGLQDDEDSTNLLTIKSENKEDTIELRFTDTGPGIAQEELTRIFDPFFTTKEPGKGTGLGLSVCYSILEGMNGKIRAESTSRKGTTIVVSIPLCYKE